MGSPGDPGPSTMASSYGSSSPSSSPPVPPGVRNRVKSRVINLVNPADPLDFSSGMSPGGTPDDSWDTAEEASPHAEGSRRRGSRETTPTVYMGEQALNVPVFSIRGVDDNGVKGILRQTGTPGSGNGVRFFPKNRFRVITPNSSSLTTPQPRPPSLFSQLLSVVPPLSPLRPKLAPIPVVDESWEQPGQEGEISMAASSIASSPNVSLTIPTPSSRDDTLGSVEDSWSGVPTQISSPLALPIETSREVSFQELPSAELHVPDDMSNLLSTRFSPPPGDSFSILQMPNVPLHSIPPSSTDSSLPSEPISAGNSWANASMSSSANGSVIIHDDAPTIRRRLSPRASPGDTAQIPATPHSPTPSADGRQWRSIFADMSAEQAELSWPLSRPAVVDDDGEVEAAFHSIALTDAADLPDLPLPLSAADRTSPTRPTTSTPRAAGNVTEYFEASSFAWATPCPKPAASAPAPTTNPVAPRSHLIAIPSLTASHGLVQPAQALFEAQAEHTSAILAELTLYRDLAQTLSQEVHERDRALADLNLLAVEAEMLKSQNADLEAELFNLRSAASASASPGGDSPSPSLKAMSRRTHPGDRTTMEQAENRDLEIRLAKSQVDQEVLVKQLNEMRGARDDVLRQLAESRKVAVAMEERERDRLIGASREGEQLRAALLSAEDTAEGLRKELHVAHGTTEDAARETAELRRQIEAYAAREESLADELGEVGRQLEAERASRADANKASEQVDALQKELAKLRLDSSSKDLEISALQRRKAELKEDREMLNIALDSKQQELELLKRKYGVRGVAGSTPLGTSRKANLETPIPGASSLPKGLQDTAPRTTRKASASRAMADWETPLVSDRRTMRHGVPLHASTIKGKGMRGIEEELRAQDAAGGSVRRGRTIA